MRILLLPILFTFLVATCVFTQAKKSPKKPAPVTYESVRSDFSRAWDAYETYAGGHDVLKPISGSFRDWYAKPLQLTPIDAFDTAYLMGLPEEKEDAKKLIIEKLSFDVDVEVQTFEITIRCLGGLISAYQLDGDKRFLTLADDLGQRLLPEFDSPTGMPYRFVHLQTGKVRDSINNPAEIGTCLLEFGMLSKLTGKKVYYEKAKRALVEVYNRRSSIGLVGTSINVETGQWVDSTSHIGGMIDSYYEYLLKAWRLFDDQECKTMFDSSMIAVNKYVADTRYKGLWYGQVDMMSGKRLGTRFGSLEAFFPAVLAMSGDLDRAKQLQTSCYAMWNLNHIEPEELDYSNMNVTVPQYILRPEIIESAYYLWEYTHDPKYKEMGETFYGDLVKYCRVKNGFAALKSVKTKEKMDRMDSFFLAETMKYAFLLLAPEGTFNFNDYTFNTEAHPFKKVK